MKAAKKRSVGKTVSNAVIIVILVLTILLTAVLFIGKMMNKPVFIFGRSIAWIITDSMEDTIPAQTFILLESAGDDDVSVGDVIIFRSENPALNGGYNTHRVIEISADRSVFTTKGDHNTADDGAYSAKAGSIVGKYVKNLPVLTALARFFSKPYGFVLLVLLVLGLTVVMFVPDAWKARRACADKKKEESFDLEAEKRKRIDAEIERLKKENQNNGGAQPPDDQQSTDADS